MALGENLIAKGLLTQAQLDAALAKQKETPGERIGEILVKLGFVTKDQVESSL
jgi:bacteriophage N4 adsorption protein B